MTSEECKEIIYTQTMQPSGFLWGIRENRVDKQQFQQLVDAIEQLRKFNNKEKKLDRIIVAYLFEAPWEIENTVSHYASTSEALGQEVSRMADALRTAIHNFLWEGLEESFMNIV
jgi:adenine-specific DNA methylase